MPQSGNLICAGVRSGLDRGGLTQSRNDSIARFLGDRNHCNPKPGRASLRVVRDSTCLLEVSHECRQIWAAHAFR